MKPKIFIAVPTMSYIHTYLHTVIMRWALSGKYELAYFCTVNTQPVDIAREEIVAEFLKTRCDYLLMIDSDTIPPEDAIDKMIEDNKDIVSAITPIIMMDKDENPVRKWNCQDKEGNWVKPNTGLVPIKGCGASCIMIKRKVFETVKFPFFRFAYSDVDKHTTVLSEDMFFIAKATDAGLKPYSDTSIICKHYKPAMF